jgi:hypothetical protein
MQAWGLRVAVVIALGLAGCSREADPTASQAATPAAADAAQHHPCQLLADASIAALVPGVAAGAPETEDERYGISACRWATASDPVLLQTFNVGPGALVSELRAAALEVVDVRRPDASTVVRLEELKDIGDLAGGYVEAVDAERGVRRASAVVMVQRGQRLAVLRIPQLAQQERPAALAAMRRLAGEIAQRL